MIQAKASILNDLFHLSSQWQFPVPHFYFEIKYNNMVNMFYHKPTFLWNTLKTLIVKPSSDTFSDLHSIVKGPYAEEKPGSGQY